ncbi:MAG TPA: leucine--tRNA ligase [Candidatus Paceibacterota bacterium]|nr:leucine--tRNA ligase [Candidatus Paceibacterota bacterium]HMP18767.1 leucine--tRNA ligase [Candidatus Paceibacterota bacterium]HMP85336.1 leucine--tRNA ligase [Candidatus Paceibacterota bacterium]
MKDSYNHKEIEQKWQKFWQENKVFKTQNEVSGKENEYILVEFPYPSGDLHVGHWYAFSVTDIYAKFKRFNNKNVLFPIGFDSFGLPAENAAIKRKLNPKTWTYSNIDSMTKQMISMGASFDWDRKVVTSDPEYYKWTQWIFTKMFERGLAYKKKATVNWDPIDKTVLANEQVLPDGTAERSGAKVEKKEIEQWFIKITDYADILFDDLDNLNWPKEIKEMQKNWIGRNEGVEFEFDIKNFSHKIKVFTTRLDTIFGVSYVVLAPEHNLIEELINNSKNKSEIISYIEKSKQKNEIERSSLQKEKTGILIDGVFAINPINKEEIPIFVADYVLANYGTGAVMAVPAHDQRDFEFAQKFNLPIKKVIQSKNSTEQNDCFTEKGVLTNSQEFNGLDSDDAIKKILPKVSGEFKKTYRLRDWSVGRQRYWGCPVPVVYDPKGNPHPIPKEKLPWLLPEDVDHTPTGVPPLAKSKELKERTEKEFGKGWTPEIETLDTFIDSSWYYLRYLDPHNDENLCDSQLLKKWMPISFYSGGAEHTTLHLLYSRFFYKFLKDIGLVFDDEPYLKRLNRGIILGTDGNKMSKSKGNVINPDLIVEKLGSDTVRTYLAFIGPYNEAGSYPWDTNGVVGVRRFLEKVWRISQNNIAENSSDEVLIEINKLIQKTEKDFGNLKLNTIVAQMMSFANVVDKNKISKEDFSKFIVILSNFAPHLCEEIWQKLGNKNSIFDQVWPKYDASMVEIQNITIAIQINGKVRAEIEIKIDEEEEIIKNRALEKKEVQKWIENKEIKKFIYIKGKIVNIVAI